MDPSEVAQALLFLSKGAAATTQHHAEVQAHSAGIPHLQFVLNGTHPIHISLTSSEQ